MVSLNRALFGATFPGLVAPDPGSGIRKWLDVSALAGLWLVAGIILALSLSRFVIAARPGARQEALRGLAVGIRAGIATALVGLGLYIVAVRSAYLIGGFVGPETMGARLSALYLSDGPLGLRILMLPVATLQLAWLSGVWGRLLLLGFAVVLVALWRRRIRWPYAALALAIALFAMRPYLTWSAPLVLVLGIVAWGVPGALLGVSAPYLRPSLVPRANWAWLAWISGVLVTATTYWLKGPGWRYGVAALLGALGIAFRLGWQVRQWWPVAALLLGLSLAGATSVVNRATFKGVLGEIRTLNERADPLIDLAAADTGSVSAPTTMRVFREPMPSWQRQWSRLHNEDEPRRLAYEVQVTQRLEIALLGSLGFWITIALFCRLVGTRPAEDRD
ncbi:MAG: hypothetical protein ACT4P6_09930 [Gemmatimonadaceae bacterium]